MKLVLAAAGAAILVATAEPAHAALPCWRAVLNDWSDGSIDRTYAPRCYTTALDRLPDDIGRALAVTARRTSSARSTASARPAASVRPAVARTADAHSASRAKLILAAGALGLAAVTAAAYALRRRSVRNVIE